MKQVKDLSDESEVGGKAYIVVVRAPRLTGVYRNQEVFEQIILSACDCPVLCIKIVESHLYIALYLGMCAVKMCSYLWPHLLCLYCSKYTFRVQCPPLSNHSVVVAREEKICAALDQGE